jgi:hypothetical protein
MITSAEVEALTMQLQKNGNGAAVHTANKASMYLRQIADKPKAKFSNCSADQFVQAVRDALYLGKWKDLSNLMGAWW